MLIYTQSATVEDIPTIQGIVDAYQLALDPNEKRMGESEAQEMLEGFFEPSTTLLCRSEASDEWDSLIALHPDQNRERFYLDIYFLPECQILEEVFSKAITIAAESHPDWRLWLGVHKLDLRYKELLHRRGFSILRKYWTMEMELNSEQEIQIRDQVTITEVNLDDVEERRNLWKVHQDSFSSHFGFKERSFEEWSQHLLQKKETLKIRAWLLRIEGEPAGFLDCDEGLLHEGTGYVAGLGVIKSFQGRGLGEQLLRFAIANERSLGRSKLALNVDAGNESGALRLYEKVGMKPISEWHQYENLEWSKGVKRV